MKPLYKNPIIIILALLSIVGYVIFEDKLPSIDLSNIEPGNIIAVLAYISVIMLVVEQCIEVFIDDPNQKVKQTCRRRIEQIDEEIGAMQLEEITGIAEGAEGLKIEENIEMTTLKNEKDELENVLLIQEQKRHKRTTFVAFILGLILAFFGIRLLSGILFNEPEQTISGIQETVIRSIDIILTATTLYYLIKLSSYLFGIRAVKQIAVFGEVGFVHKGWLIAGL